MGGEQMNGVVKRRLDGNKRVERDEVQPPAIDNREVLASESSSNAQPRAKPETVAATVLSPVILTSFVLIFGGCCSNVYALESIVKLSPASGTLVTFLQFLLTAIFALPSQITFKSDRPGSARGFIPRLRTRTIPLYKWLVYTGFFLTINTLNNAVFYYSISIPLHIILRSASPVTSMVVGYLLAGRRYTPRQIFAVVLLFIGVVLAALSDAQAKAKPIKDEGSTLGNGSSQEGPLQTIQAALSNADIIKQAPGFVFLFSALILSAVMGIYTDKIYDQHGRSIAVTEENLFYSHALSLPWFALQRAKLTAEYVGLMDNAAIMAPSTLASDAVHTVLLRVPKVYAIMPSFVHSLLQPSNIAVVSLLIVNALTQIICITGVNRLSTETTSLTVTIVLNVRKLVSLLLSIWLFGNALSAGVGVGATMVFIGGALYGLSGSKKSTTSSKKAVGNGQPSGKQKVK